MLVSLSGSSISLATVTPSLVTVGAPQDFSMMTLRPRGPSVTLTVLARMLSPLAMLWRALSEKTISLADMNCISVFLALLKRPDRAGGSHVSQRPRERLPREGSNDQCRRS